MADKDGATHLITEINAGKELEVSWVRRGSNPKSKVFLKKSADEDPSQTETTKMALKSVALAALMSTVAGVALAKSFDKEEQLDAFLAKSDEEQTAELAAFAKAKGMPMEPDGDDTKTASTKKGEETPAGDAGADALSSVEGLEKALANSPLFKGLVERAEKAEAQVQELTGGLTKTNLEKRAQTEFKGLGLGLAKTVSVLGALEKMEPDVRETVEGVLKAHAELAGKIAGTIGLQNLNKDANSATVKLQKVAEELAVKKSISKEEAYTEVCEDPQYADLVEKADAEFEEVSGADQRAA